VAEPSLPRFLADACNILVMGPVADRGATISTGIRLARRRALDIEAGWTVEDAQATGWPNDHPDRVEPRWRASQGTLGVNQDAPPGEGR
jgi:hypothetical protein